MWWDTKLEMLRSMNLPAWTSFQLGGEQYMTEQTGTQKAIPTRSSIPSNTIFIGQKPLMSYVTAIVMQFNSGSNELAVKARGRMISQAVDVVEVCRRRFFADKLNITEIKIGTEVLGEEGQSRNVSTIEIKLTKKE
jgi:DNA-binding protein